MNKNYSIIGLITVLATILIGYFSGVITEIDIFKKQYRYNHGALCIDIN
ncbi:hypothetical protein PT078_07390 [Erysipelothrix rhusiopathiae]|nr:hypothetical protein [Erysipelothrix rhusiopathiae]MDE8144016.1 hypothetical protein [Erysipelothrix rhusiopathiae]